MVSAFRGYLGTSSWRTGFIANKASLFLIHQDLQPMWGFHPHKGYGVSTFFGETCMQKKFNPTQVMIRAAETVFLAQAFLEMVRPIVLDYQKRILAEGQWKVRPEYNDRRSECIEEIVIEPANSFLMSEADFKIYHAKCNEARKVANLVVEDDEQCPLLVAENQLRKAKIELCNVMEPVTGIDYNKVAASLDGYARYFDLVLRLLGPYVSSAKTIMQRSAPASA